MKQITETSVNSIWNVPDIKIPKENLGCRFPKITLGAPSDTYTFSMEDLTRLFSLCATMEHFEEWWIKNGFSRGADPVSDSVSTILQEKKPIVTKNDIYSKDIITLKSQ